MLNEINDVVKIVASLNLDMDEKDLPSDLEIYVQTNGLEWEVKILGYHLVDSQTLEETEDLFDYIVSEIEKLKDIFKQFSV
jgi:hypothetical protein